MDLKEMGFKCVYWIKWSTVLGTVTKFRDPRNYKMCSTSWATIRLWRKTLLNGISKLNFRLLVPCLLASKATQVSDISTGESYSSSAYRNKIQYSWTLNIIPHAIKATFFIWYVVQADTNCDQSEIPPNAHISRTPKVKCARLLVWAKYFN
jgi:uncharacterized membrane protein YagU involved in acid resistance